MKKLYILSIIGLVAAGSLLSGCKKLIEIDPPLNEVPSAVIFKSDKTAKGALVGLYTYLQSTQVQTINLTAYSSLQGDDMLYLTAGNATYEEFANNTSVALSSGASGLFTEWYATIYRANAIILGLQQYTGTSAAVNKQLTAEAKFIRAYCYFNLVNTFGDVPLVLQTDVNVTAFQPRTPTSQIYAQMVQDLTDAKANLLADYSSTSSNRNGANKFAAAALLARVYLFMGNYALAESNASEVIASPLYTMIPKATMATALFVKNSSESILQMPNYLSDVTQYTAEGSSFIPATYTVASIFWRISPNLVNTFAATDLRRLNWMRDVVSGTETYATPFKFKYRNNTLAVAAGITEVPMVLRLAEQYLIRAEARARIGSNLSGALADMNVTRLRANLTESTTLDQATLITEIAAEKRKEFFCEQAYRWYDLKRTGQADAVLSALKPSYTPKSKLLPIPQTAIDANPNLTQNPGY